VPEFSVVIPNKNRKEALMRAVGSVLAQSFEDYEILIVDDSDPSTFGELKEYFSRFEKVKLIRGDGIDDGHARKKGFDLSSGKYVALLDSDDEWLPRKLEKHHRLLKMDEGIGMSFDLLINVDEVAGTREFIRPPPKIWEYDGSALPPELVRNELIKANFIHCSSGVLVKEKLKSLGGFISTRPADYMNWLRMSERYRFGIVREYLTVRNFGPSSLGRRKKCLLEETRNSASYRLSLVGKYGYGGELSRLAITAYLLFLMTGLGLYLPQGARSLGRSLMARAL
jgi:glycosyltransferase involved in cell wall biosynthesis